MSKYHGKHRQATRFTRARWWVVFLWAFIRAGTAIFAITILVNSLAPLPHL